MLVALIPFILLVAGCVVWASIIRRLARNEPALDPVPKVEPAWGVAAIITVAVFVALQLAGRVAAELQMLESPEGEGIVSLKAIQLTVMFNALLMALLLFFLSAGGKRDVGEFGIHADRPDDDTVIALRGFLASFPPVLIVVLATAFLKSEERTHAFIRLAGADPSTEVFVWIGVTAMISAPLAEELVFRVVLQGWLRTKMSAPWAIGISSVTFCAVHGFPDSLALLPLAIILGYVFEQRRSYLAVVLLHALFNAQTMITLVLYTLGQQA